MRINLFNSLSSEAVMGGTGLGGMRINLIYLNLMCGMCFEVWLPDHKKSSDGKTYLRLNGDLGWTYTASRKDVKKIVVNYAK